MIDVESLSFSYVSDLTGERVNALGGVDLSATPGTLTLVCGASGCGKSTLIKALTGLIPQMNPGDIGGTVAVSGRDLAEVPLTEVGHLSAAVFQNPRTQFFCETVAEELAFCGENYGRAPSRLREDGERAAALMGITHLMSRKLATLSGGQLQKVALACALASGAPVLLADEPTSNLDGRAIANVREALRVLKEQGMTIVVVEHRLHFLRGLADQVLLVEKGTVSRRWSGEEFYSMDEGMRRALGLRSLRDPGPPRSWMSPEPEETQAPQNGDTARLSCTNLSVSYGDTPVIESFSADFPAGSVTCITGENGAGKTTLARTLCGLAKPSGGTISIDGVVVSRRARRGACALVMQDTGRQLFSDTLAGELTIGASQARGEAGERLLADFDLADLADRHPLSLSGGQKQRLVIAAARATNRPIVILDEPTSGVDARHLDSIVATLRRMADEGAAVIVVTHDGEFASACADRLITLTPTGAGGAREGGSP